jgi:hypothetical protein
MTSGSIGRIASPLVIILGGAGCQPPVESTSERGLNWLRTWVSSGDMLTIVQSCPVPGCDGEVRYTHRGLNSTTLRGNCQGCGRVFRLRSGRPTEIDRRLRVGRAQSESPDAA